MKQTILGIFDDPIDARQAIDALRSSELDIDDVSIISRATETGAPISSVDDVSAGEGAAVGAVWGGLVGLAALLIPGVGPFIAFGALGAALTGAVTGALVGGVSAALIDFSGISEQEARHYEQQVHAGKTLVAVKLDAAQALDVRRILVESGASSLRENQTDMLSGNKPVHVESHDASGQTVNQAVEYGVPNPVTVDREPFPMPAVDPTPNSPQPVIEDTPTASAPVGIGRASQIPPRTDAPNTGVEQMKTPEALGSPPTTPKSPDATTPNTPAKPDSDAPDTNLSRTN